MTESDVLRSAIDIIASVTSLLKKLLTSSQASYSIDSTFFFWEVASLSSLVLSLPLEDWNFLWLSGCLQDMQYCKNGSDGQANGHQLQQLNGHCSTLSIKVVSSVPNPPRTIQADSLPHASTPVLERYPSSHEHCVWAQDDAKKHCSELATGQPLLWTYQSIIPVNWRNCATCASRKRYASFSVSKLRL